MMYDVNESGLQIHHAPLDTPPTNGAEFLHRIRYVDLFVGM